MKLFSTGAAALVMMTVTPMAEAQTPTPSTTPMSLSASSDDEFELATDRPDFTETSEVVGRGQLQIESGFVLESDRREDIETRAITTPSVLARIGVGHNLELRVAGDGYLRGWSTSPGDHAVSGYSDVELGAKYKFVRTSRLSMTVIPSLSIPTRDSHYSSGTYDAMVKVTWATALPLHFDIGGNLNDARLSDERGRFTQRAASVSIAHDIKGPWGAYGEAFGFTPMERGAGPGWTVNSGVTRAVGRDMQVDVELGRGVTPDAPDWFMGVGFAVRGHLHSLVH